MQDLRPFHESVIDALQSATGSQLVILADLLKTTRIPKNHDAVIAAWKKRTHDMNSPDYNVSPSLQEQKEREDFTARLVTGC